VRGGGGGMLHRITVSSRSAPALRNRRAGQSGSTPGIGGMSRGVDGFKMNDATVGTSSPGDVEFRFNVTDTHGKNMNDGDLCRTIQAFQRWLLTNGNLAIANQPSGPPS
jgi:hypothetical protein